MNDQEYRELALDYLQGRLSKQEKHEVYQLVSEEPQFVAILHEELELCKKLAGLKQVPSEELRERVYRSITTDSSRKAVAWKVVNLVMQQTLPAIAWLVIKQFQRSVCVNE